MEVKDLIRSACGPDLTIKQFAKKITDSGFSVSASTIYRIASGDIKIPVSDDLLRAIANNADENSGITYTMLKEAFTDLLNNQQDPGIRMLKQQKAAVTAARNAIISKLMTNGGLKVQKVGLASLSTPENQIDKIFHFAFQVERGSVSQTILFKVVNSEALGLTYDRKIDSFVGSLLRTQERHPDRWYYLAIYRNNKNDCNEIEDAFAQNLWGTFDLTYGNDLPINLGLLLIEERKGGEFETTEFISGSGGQIAALSSGALGDDFSDSYYTTDDYLIVGSSQLEAFDF